VHLEGNTLQHQDDMVVDDLDVVEGEQEAVLVTTLADIVAT
jgi:hypothetical protein